MNDAGGGDNDRAMRKAGEKSKTMNSKEIILKKLSADGMPEYPYPAPGFTPQRFDDPAAMFAERLEAAGGRAVRMLPGETLDEAVRRCYPDARTIASAMPELSVATLDPDAVEDARELVDVDLLADAAAKAFNATFDVDDSLVNEDESELPPELLSAPAVAD